LAALSEKTRPQGNALQPIFLFFIYLFLIMAFRGTGGDFYTYNLAIELYAGESLARWMAMTEPAYGFLNWLSIQAGWGIYGVNACCALIFLFGLYRFALNEPRPWLIIAIAMPYLVIVVAIGYTRQGTAVGLLMFALAYIRRSSVFKATASILLATAFHNSALVAAPLLYFALNKKWYQKYILIALLAPSLFGIYLIIMERVETLTRIYTDSNNYESSGAVLRAFITAVAGVIFLHYGKRWRYLFDDWKMYFYVALVALAMFPASFIYSTAADRMGLYLLPFQVLVFARLPVLMSNNSNKNLATLGVLVAYSLVLFVWLHLGQFSQQLWLPYSNLLIGTLP
jgi:hypothetical protein